MKYPKKEFWKKMIVSALAVIMLCQNAHALSERQSSLSSKSFLEDPEFQGGYRALTIVTFIMEVMRKNKPSFTIEDLFVWRMSSETIFNDCRFIKVGNELWIEGRGWLVRFFNPSEESLTSAILENKWIRYTGEKNIQFSLAYEIYLKKMDEPTIIYDSERRKEALPELETNIEIRGERLLDRKTGTKAVYDTKGKLVSILDRNGNTIERRYYYLDGRLAYLELMNISGREEDKLTVEGKTLPGMTGIGYDIWRQGEYIGFFSCVIGRDKKIFSIRNISCTNKSAAETMLMWLTNGASMMNMSLEVVNLQPKIQLVPVIGKYLRPVIFIVVDAEEKRKLLGTVILGRKGLKLKLDDKKTSEAFLLTKDGAIINGDTNEIIGWISEWLSGINIMGIPRRTFMTRAGDGSVCIEEGERQHVLDGETATQTSL